MTIGATQSISAPVFGPAPATPSNSRGVFQKTTSNSETSIFQKIFSTVLRNPVKSALFFTVTAGLTPALLAVGTLAATIVAGIFVIFSTSLAIIASFAVREIVFKNQTTCASKGQVPKPTNLNDNPANVGPKKLLTPVKSAKEHKRLEELKIIYSSIAVKYVNNLLNTTGVVPSTFVHEYLKPTDGGEAITPAGATVLIGELKKIGKAKIDCTACLNFNVLKSELQCIQKSKMDVSKIFLVKSNDPSNHLSVVYVKKMNGSLRVLTLDTHGGETDYDPSLFYNLKEMAIPNLELFHLVEKREWNSTKEGVFALHDVICINKFENLLDELAIKAQGRALEHLPYLPDVKYRPIYLRDLPLKFMKFINCREALQKHAKERTSEEQRILMEKGSKYVSDLAEKSLKGNVLSHHHFNKYAKTLIERMKFEFHVKTTNEGNILTPSGMNIIFETQRKAGSLKVPCRALGTHEEFREIIHQIMSNPDDTTQGFILKSDGLFDHQTPVYVRKEKDELQVIIMDTQGGEPHYDFSTLLDLQLMNIPRLKVYNLVEKRQWDMSTCPVYSNDDILNLSQMDDCFDFFAQASLDRPEESLLTPNVPYLPSTKFKPLYLKDLPPQFLRLTTRFATLEKYFATLPEKTTQEWRESILKHTIEIDLGDKIIKSNIWAQEINEFFSDIIRKAIT